MGSAGDPLDNAMCKSFFATLECELIARTRFYSRGDVHWQIRKYRSRTFIRSVPLT